MLGIIISFFIGAMFGFFLTALVVGTRRDDFDE